MSKVLSTALRLRRARASAQRLTIAGRARAAVTAPARGVHTRRFDYSLDEIAQTVLREPQFDGAAAAAQVLTRAQQEPDRFRADWSAAAMSMASAAHTAARAAFPDLRAPEAQRTTYTVDLNPPAGHAAIGVTFVAHPQPDRLVASPNALRYFVAGFPGGGFELSGRTAAYLMRDTILDGSAQGRLATSRDEILRFAQDRYRAAAPVQNALWVLGANSVIHTAFAMRDPIHRPGSGVAAGQVAMWLNQTTLVHSQDGIVPWTAIVHEDFGDLVACVNLHLGNSQVPGGNALNALIGPPMFSVPWRAGALMEEVYDKLAADVGADRAAGLMSDPMFAKAFLAELGARDWMLHRDWRWFAAADRTGGAVLNQIRQTIGGDTIATFDADPYDAIETADDYAAKDEAAVARTAAEGYTGGPRIEPEDADAIIVTAGELGASNVAGRDNPDDARLLPDVQPTGAAIAAEVAAQIAETMPDELDRVVKDAVHTAFGAVDEPAGKSPAELLAVVSTDALRGTIRGGVGNAVLELAAGGRSYAAAQALADKTATAPLAEDLVAIAVADPLWRRLTEVQDGSSFLEARIRTHLASELHATLASESDLIEQRLAELDASAQETSAEQAEKQKALDDVVAQRKGHETDPDLLKQQHDLEAALATLARQQELDDEERADADKDASDNDRRAREAEASGADADGYAERHGERVFGSGAGEGGGGGS